MKVYLKRFFIIATISAILIGLDIASKVQILNFFSTREDVYEIFSLLNIVLVKNYGISFGTFNSPQTSQLYLIAITALISLVFLIWGIRNPDNRLLIPISAIVGGALGNIIDRINYGGVIDFIDFHYGALHFPAFNLADTCVFLGVAAIILIPSREIKNSSVAKKQQSK